MKFIDSYGRERNLKNAKKYLINWDKPSRSKFQTRVKDFLRSYWQHDVVFEEFRVVGTRLTLDFYNDVYSPFLVLKKNYGGRGYTYDYTGAYNLNEVMNRSLFNFAEEDGLPDIPDNPPYEKEADTLVGPGVNTNKDSTDYPRGYTPNPIGSYHITSTGDYCPQTSIGQVVNLSVIDETDLTLFGLKLTQGYTGEKKKIYYFSAENAHDGLCEGDCNNGY